MKRKKKSNKLKKKLEDAKIKAERKEDMINKLLREAEDRTKENTELEEKVKEYEFEVATLSREKEQSHKIIEAMKESEKQSRKENEFKEMVPKEQMLGTVNDLQKSFLQERTELKNQLIDLQSKNQKEGEWK